MQFSFMDDPGWGQLDHDTKQAVIVSAFEDDIVSDPGWSNLDDDTKRQVQDSYFQDAEEYSRKVSPHADGFLGAVTGGAEHALSSVMTAWNALTGDDEEVKDLTSDASRILKTSEQDAFIQSLQDKKTDDQKVTGWESFKQGLGNVAGAAWDEPMGALHEVAGQIPNAGIALGGMWAGAKTGAAVGSLTGTPLGAGVGGIVGGIMGLFFGNAALEVGNVAQDQARAGTYDRGDTLKRGTIKGAVITGVDTATMGISKALFTPAFRAAGKASQEAVENVLKASNINPFDDAAVKLALSQDAGLKKAVMDAGAKAALEAAPKGIKNAGLHGIAMGADIIGEGGGEFYGSMAAGLNPDISDAILEAAMSMPHGAAEVAVGKSLAKGKGLLAGSDNSVSSIGAAQTADEAVQAFESSVSDELDSVASEAQSDEMATQQQTTSPNLMGRESDEFSQFQESFRDQKIDDFEQELKQAQTDIQSYSHPDVRPEMTPAQREAINRMDPEWRRRDDAAKALEAQIDRREPVNPDQFNFQRGLRAQPQEQDRMPLPGEMPAFQRSMDGKGQRPFADLDKRIADKERGTTVKAEMLPAERGYDDGLDVTADAEYIPNSVIDQRNFQNGLGDNEFFGMQDLGGKDIDKAKIPLSTPGPVVKKSLTTKKQTPIVKENLTVAPGAAVTWQNKKGQSFSGMLVQKRPGSKSTWQIKRGDGKRVFLSEKSFSVAPQAITDSRTVETPPVTGELQTEPVNKQSTKTPTEEQPHTGVSKESDKRPPLFVTQESNKKDSLKAGEARGASDDSGITQKDSEGTPNQTPLRKQRTINDIAGGEVRLSTSNDLKSVKGYIQKALAGEGLPNKKIGVVSSEHAKRIQSLTGVDVSGFTHELVANDIRHAMNSHGDAKKEAKRNQVAITEDDLRLIPDIIASPDSIQKGSISNQGQKSVRFIKRVNGTIVYVEVVHKKGSLQSKTLWKKPSASADAASRMPSDNTSETAVSPLLDNNISNKPDSGNEKYQADSGAPQKIEQPDKQQSDYGQKNKVFTKEGADKARELLRKKLSGTQLNSGIDPEVMLAGIQLAGYHIEAGARSFSEYSKAMIKDVGETIKPYLRSFYEGARHYPEFDSAGMDDAATPDATPKTQGDTIGKAVSARINDKYADILSLPEDLSGPEILDGINEGTLTPRALDKFLEKSDSLEEDIQTAKAAVADRIGDLKETYRYESEKEGKVLEEYIDSLLTVLSKDRVSGNALPDRGATSKDGEAARGVSDDSGVKENRAQYSTSSAPEKGAQYSLGHSPGQDLSVGEDMPMFQVDQAAHDSKPSSLKGDPLTPTEPEKKKTYSQIASGISNVIKNRKNKGPGYKKDIGVIENTLGLMSHYSEGIPALKRAFEELLKRPEWKFQKENELFKNGEESMIGTIEDLQKHNKAAYFRLKEYLVDRDINQIGAIISQDEDGTWTIKSPKDERTGKRSILEEGISTKKKARDLAIQYEVDEYPDSTGRDALRAFRTMTANLHDFYAESWEAIMKEYEDRGLTLPEVVSRTKSGEVRIDLKVALAQMGERSSYYFPRQRSNGDWQVFASKKGEHDFIEYRDLKTTADYLAGRMIAEGYDVEVKKVGSMSEDLFQGVGSPLFVQSLVNQALAETKMDVKVRDLKDLGLKGEWRKDGYYIPNGGVYEWSSSVLSRLGGREYSDHGKRGMSWSPGYWFENAPKDIEEVVTNALYVARGQETDVSFEIAQSLANQLSDTLRSRGSRARMISRSDAIGKDVPIGYETDPLKAIAQAVNSAAGGYAKQQVAMNTSKAITGQHYTWDEWQKQHPDYDALTAAEDDLKSLQKNSSTEEERIADIDREIKELQRERTGVKTESEKARQDRLFRIGTLFREKEKIRKWTDKKQAADAHQEIARLRGVIHREYREYIQENMIDPKKQKRAYTDVVNAVENVLKNDEAADRVIGTLKGLASVWFLGGRLSSAAINLTAMGTTVPAAMDSYGGIPLKRTVRHIAKAGKAYASFITGKGTVSKADRAILEDIFSRGWVAAQLNMETVNALKSGPAQKYGRVVELLMTPFKITEEFNRGVTILAAYKGVVAENPDMNKEDALAKAKTVSDRAHGIYGVENQPALLRKGRGLRAASAMYIFQTFMHNYFTTLSYMIGRRQAGAATYMILSPMVFGGAASSIMLPAVKMIFKAFDEDDPEEKIYQIAEKLFGEPGGSVARYGLPGLAGVSLKGSLAPNLPDFKEPLDALGPIGGMMRNIYQGGVNITQGDYLKGVEKITPLAMGNIAKAYREVSDGVTTRAGDPVFFGDEQIKGNIGTGIMRAAGLNPTRIAKPREVQWNETTLKRQYAELKRRIYSMIIRYHAQPISKKSPTEWRDIVQDIKEFNARVKSNGLGDVVPIITAKTIKNRVRRAFRPNKRERDRA